MRVLAVDAAFGKYQELSPDLEGRELDAALHQITLDGTSRSATWTPFPVYIPEPLKQRPDFFRLSGCNGGFVVTSRAYSLIGGYLDLAGELLPLSVEGEPVWLFNTTTCIDCLDRERSIFDSSGYRLMGPAFLARRLPPARHPFRAIDVMFSVFIADDDDVTEDEPSFWSEVVSLGLTGLKFVTAWSSVTGPNTQYVLELTMP